MLERLIAVVCLSTGCGRLGFDQQVLLEDAAWDTQPDAPPFVIDTLTVPGVGTPTTSSVTLLAGVRYRVRVSGTFYIAGGTDPYGDAEYWDFTAGAKDLCDDGLTDAGLAIDDPIVDGDKQPRWGAYRPDHIYETDIIGKDAAITATIHDVAPGNNTGALQLEILSY